MVTFPRRNSGKQQEPPVNEYAPGSEARKVTASEAIAEYCMGVADHLEKTAHQIMEVAQNVATEAKLTADNIRQVGELERQRTSSIFERMRTTIVTLREMREAFAQPLGGEMASKTLDAMTNILEHAPKEIEHQTLSETSHIAEKFAQKTREH